MRSPATLVLVVSLAGSLAAGCSARKQQPPAAADAGAATAAGADAGVAGRTPDGPGEAATGTATRGPVELRGADGTLTLSVARDTNGWQVGAGGSGKGPRVRTVGDDWVLDSGGPPLATIRRGAAGPELVNAAGQVLCRIHAPDAATFDLIGPDGVALLRTRPDPESAGGAIARDAAGRPFATARIDTEGHAGTGAGPAPLVISSRDGAILAEVHATRDARAALVLALAPLPPALRALLAVYALEHPAGT